MNFEEGFDIIRRASSASMLFAHYSYKELAKVVHPDLVPEKFKKQALVIFQKLSKLHAVSEGKADPVSSVVIGDYVVGELIDSGDIADVYKALNIRTKKDVVFKIARTAKDNDLMDAEARALGILWKDVTDACLLSYIPGLYDSLKASGRAVNVIRLVEAQYLSLSSISTAVGALDFRHCVWMMNRMLAVLGYVHRCGIVHGAVVPDHMMFGPNSHGLMLIDWCYSVEIGKPVKAVACDLFVPWEIKNKKPATSATDIYMAAAYIKNAAKDVPKEFDSVFTWCLAEAPNHRPQDAWKLADLWAETAEKVYGKPSYVPLIINN